MDDRIAARPGARSAPAVLTSVPWLVVLVGAGLLAVLLVFAMLSFRGTEHQAVPPPAPPLYLPTLPASPSSAGPVSTGDAPVVAVQATRSPQASASPSGSPSASARPTATRSAGSPSASGAPPVVLGSASGRLTARYQVVASNRDSFDAVLRVDNGSDEARQWQVELGFAGNVKRAEPLSGGVSVGADGGGYVVGGTSALGAGQATTVTVRFFRNGTGDQPWQCTVDGAACTIG
ncbi:hypothetical protein [Micromonospora siamensis]|uniref:Cellulose binding domain-containing protein n=1 Tax=Micromonospora siamensis TaxID=299152 RepID=A0A1C5JBS6_9ACTN|nr:hypothetical protein [Micromonospora siamensis]SCG67988.1 hypothetical protein GA0074704_4338 [Micromonospora siamensis]